MTKTLFALALVGLLAGGLPAAGAGPTQGGYASDNVEYVGYVPFEAGTSTGISIHGKYMYQTSWKNLSIYDISDPENPELLDWEPLGFKFENEDVSIDPQGKIMLFSESLPQDVLHVYDIEDKQNIQKLAELPGAGDHTTTCILRCKWAYGSEGTIVDLRNPEKPKLVAASGSDESWHKGAGITDAHDVEEYKNGFLVVSSWKQKAFPVLDVRNPLKPRVLARGEHPNVSGFGYHSGTWPNKGKDRFILMQGEQNFRAQCDAENNGPFQTFDTRGWKKTKTVTLVDTYAVENGTYQDGAPPANALGCSAHWFDEHPKFRNGGLVAVGYYEHGTRFLHIDGKGSIHEAGWFVPWGGSTSAAYWVGKELVYAVDYTRGIDILRFKKG